MNIIQFFGITKRQNNLDNENYIDSNFLLVLEYADSALMFEISNGKRETPISDTPSDYIDIYTKCWKDNPDDRPDMEQVFSELKLINLNIIEDDAMELDEDPNNNKVIINIINELLLLHDKLIRSAVMCKESYIQLAKSYIEPI
ncbi:unnamed protein product [Rhizophagus irregularis]|nr:unnamed protein product [Rhizophagus irregularis]